MRLHEDDLDDCQPNDLPDFGDEKFEYTLQAGGLLPGGFHGMANGYIQGRVVVVIHIRIRRIDLEECNFCATFYRAVNKVGAGTASEWKTSETELSVDYVREGYIEKPVLIQVVQVSDEGKEGRKFSVESIVRLQSLNSCLRRSAQRSETAISFAWPIASPSDNRELNTPFIGGRVVPALADREAICGMIESRPQVVNAVPGDQRPSFEIGRNVDIQDDAVAARVSVTLLGESVGVSAKPGQSFGIEGIQVFFGMANLESTRGELRSDHAVHCTVAR